ncbi:MAG: SIMPL domain-containing protein [Candidatus Azambacteria bacterium]|nr:SIMPL domain-containing protein [Candidatus Azambacteria bacterium]
MFDYSELSSLEKKVIFTTVVLLALFLVFAGFNQFVNAWNNYRNAGATDAYKTVSFTGEGKIKAAPDTARVDIGLVTEGKDSITVQNENSEKMNAVIKFLKEKEKIAEADIKTSNYSLSPKYDYIKGKSVLSGYVLNQTVIATIRDLNKIGEVLDGAVTSGANQINSVSLFLDKPEELKNKARYEAVKQAQEKAAAVSKIAGFRLGRVIGFNEGFSGEPPVFYKSLEMSVGGGGGAPAPQIEPGTQDISVNITLTYLIK